jgi:hypothetical protein
MPESTTLDAPVAPVSTTVPADAPKELTGIAKAMQDFVETTKAPEPVKEPAQKQEKSSPNSQPEKKETVQAKPADKPQKQDLWEKAPEKLKNEYFKLKRESESRYGDLDKRYKDLEGKAKIPAIDPKLLENRDNEIKQLMERLARVDYRESKEYKERYVARIEQAYKNTIAEVEQLQVAYKEDTDGNPVYRKATRADFDRLMNMPVQDQDEYANKLFGRSANRVLGRLFELQRMDQEAINAVNEHSKNAETMAKEQTAKSQAEETRYNSMVEASHRELEENWPALFKADEKDPEGTKALQAGYKFVDDLNKAAANLSPEEKAAYTAVLRARAAGFLKATLDNNRLRAEVDKLKEELGKKRKSDPGDTQEAKPVGGVSSGDDYAGGIAAWASKFRE